MSLLEKVKGSTDSKQIIVAASGLGLLAFYCLYARKALFSQKHESQVEPKNSLELSLKEMAEKTKQENIIKIAILESSPSSIDYKRMIITNLKQFMISQQLNTLVNCSPLKLFEAGAGIFTAILRPNNPEDDEQYLSYFENALKCQLTIERTICDINQIKKKNCKTFIICDTNSLDLKIQNEKRIWDIFLKSAKISEESLKNNYDYIFHLQDPNSQIPADLLKKYLKDIPFYNPQKQQKIWQTWNGHKNYCMLRYHTNLMVQQNVENAIEQIINHMRVHLPPGIIYHKKKVFTKHW